MYVIFYSTLFFTCMHAHTHARTHTHFFTIICFCQKLIHIHTEPCTHVHKIISCVVLPWPHQWLSSVTADPPFLCRGCSGTPPLQQMAAGGKMMKNMMVRQEESTYFEHTLHNWQCDTRKMRCSITVNFIRLIPQITNIFCANGQRIQRMESFPHCDADLTLHRDTGYDLILLAN